MTPLAGRTVFITGASGAFGTAFIRRALLDGTRTVIAYSRSESRQAVLRSQITDPRMRWRIGDVRDHPRLIQAMRGADIVIHAAALKRVEVCQEDVREAKRTNVDGTENVALAAIECAVDRAVYLSSDKACEPNTFYGSSKHLGEGLWIGMNAYAAGARTRFAATRYGNVLESTGSVVPIWREAAKQGRPLPLTDARMTRFFMRMGDAVDLVLLALREMRGGEIFVPRIGAAKITELAAAVAPNASFSEIGIRRGEKLHETLIGEDEARDTFYHGDHYRIEPERHWTNAPDEPLGERLPEGFTYRSDTARQLDVLELQSMIRTAA